MTRLLRAETTRLLARRTVAAVLLLAALLVAVVAARLIYETRPASLSEVATARAQAQVETSAGGTAAELRACRQDPVGFLGPKATPPDCRRAFSPRTSDFLPRHPLNIDRLLDNDGARVALLVVAALVICAATYAGADWRTGSIRTQLLHEPRRWRVWSAKAVVVTVFCALVCAVLLTAFWAALFLAADHRGLDTGGLLGTTVWHVLRAVALAAGAGLGGYALTMLFRSSLATLALLFAYVAGGEVLINLVPVAGGARWTANANLFGWLADRYTYVDPAVGCRAFSNCDATRSLDQLQAAWFLLALLAVAVVASVLAFRRRDV
ncbi:MAG: ABC transporter permease subunit [Marmoricola sp.]